MRVDLSKNQVQVLSKIRQTLYSLSTLPSIRLINFKKTIKNYYC